MTHLPNADERLASVKAAIDTLKSLKWDLTHSFNDISLNEAARLIVLVREMEDEVKLLAWALSPAEWPIPLSSGINT